MFYFMMAFITTPRQKQMPFKNIDEHSYRARIGVSPYYIAASTARQSQRAASAGEEENESFAELSDGHGQSIIITYSHTLR